MSDSGESPEPNSIVFEDERPNNTMTWYASDGVINAAVTGELDLYNSSRFKGVIIEEIANNPEARLLRLDLTQTQFIDTTVLGVLVGATKRLRPRQAESGDKPVEIRVKSQNLAKIFEITGLDRVFKIVEVEDEPDT